VYATELNDIKLRRLDASDICTHHPMGSGGGSKFLQLSQGATIGGAGGQEGAQAGGWRKKNIKKQKK